MQTPQELVGNLIRVARIARRSGPAHVAPEAARWELELEARLAELNEQQPPKPRGRPRRGPVLQAGSAPADGFRPDTVPAEAA